MIPWTPIEGFSGGSYQLKARGVDYQRTVNMFPEAIESGSGKNGRRSYLKSIPGYEQILEVGTGPIRLIHVDNPVTDVHNPTNRIFIVSGSEVYRGIWDESTNTWDMYMVGGFSNSEGISTAASSQIELGVTVFTDGYAPFIYRKRDVNPWNETFGIIKLSGNPFVQDSIIVLWLDGYFIFIQKNRGKFYISQYNSFNLDPLDFASAEGDIDNIISAIVNNRDLVLLNERSYEVWTNTGNADFPFERVSGGFNELGCAASFSVAKIDGIVFWLSRTISGQGQIIALQGLSPQRISTHALEEKISTYANIHEANAYTYQKDGHSFYVINFAEATWAYDLSTKLWSERSFFEKGEHKRHRFVTKTFFPAMDAHLAGDYESNKVYLVNDSIYDQNGTPLVRERVFPHISANGNLITCYALKIEMEVGVGLNGDVQGSDPKAMLSWSDDDGHTWSDEITESVGKIGEKRVRVIFRQLGIYRSRIYKLRFSDPIPVTLLAADAQLKVRAA